MDYILYSLSENIRFVFVYRIFPNNPRLTQQQDDESKGKWITLQNSTWMKRRKNNNKLGTNETFVMLLCNRIGLMNEVSYISFIRSGIATPHVIVRVTVRKGTDTSLKKKFPQTDKGQRWLRPTTPVPSLLFCFLYLLVFTSPPLLTTRILHQPTCPETKIFLPNQAGFITTPSITNTRFSFSFSFSLNFLNSFLTLASALLTFFLYL